MTTTETNDTTRVLELLAQGKITVAEAEQLLRAVHTPGGASGSGTESGTAPRWMRITIDREAGDGRPPKNVNIRVPLALARSGIRLGAMLPFVFGPRLKEEFRKQGVDIDFSKINLSDLEAAAKDLRDSTIDIDGGKAKVQIRCE